MCIIEIEEGLVCHGPTFYLLLRSDWFLRHQSETVVISCGILSAGILLEGRWDPVNIDPNTRPPLIASITDVGEGLRLGSCNSEPAAPLYRRSKTALPEKHSLHAGLHARLLLTENVRCNKRVTGNFIYTDLSVTVILIDSYKPGLL